MKRCTRNAKETQILTVNTTTHAMHLQTALTKRGGNENIYGRIHWRKELTLTRAHIASSLSKSLNLLYSKWNESSPWLNYSIVCSQWLELSLSLANAHNSKLSMCDIKPKFGSRSHAVKWMHYILQWTNLSTQCTPPHSTTTS